MHPHFTMTFPSFHFTILTYPSHYHHNLLLYTSPHRHFTSLRCLFWWFPPLLHFALFIIFLTLLLKLLGLQERVGKHGSVSVNALCCKPKVVGSSPDEVDFLNWPNPSSRTMSLGVDSASNRNEYQEFLKIKKPGGKVWLAHRLPTLPPSISRSSK
jgi:hypothetical protein